MRKIFVSIVLVLAMATVSLGANANAGKNAYTFLKVGVGAKAQAMAGAFAGLADDISSLYYNPAGLTAPIYIFHKAKASSSESSEYAEGEEPTATMEIKPTSRNRFVATYLNYILDFQSGYLGYVRSLDDKTAAGISINYQGYGSFKRLDSQGNDDGNFSAYDMALGLTYSKKLASNIFVGGTGKLIIEKIDSYSSDALGLDLGILYHLADGRTGLGLTVTNLGFQLKGLTKAHKDPLPLTIDGGFSHHLKGLPLTVTADIVVPTDNKAFFALGGQFESLRPFLLRVGWSSAGQDYKTGSSKDGRAGFAGGFGYQYQGYIFDYSYSSYADLGNVHRLTFNADF
jgi:hypothetical protein